MFNTINNFIKKIETLSIVLLLLLIVVLTFIFNKTIVEGNSMNNTYQNGDNLLASLVYSEIKRSEIVVFYSDNNGAGNWNFIPNNMFSILWQTRNNGTKTRDIFVKRVIGLPGDTIEIKNDQLYLNDELYKENYVTFDTSCNKDMIFNDKIKLAKINTKKTIVPQNYYYLMGDNRYCSYDSRDLGPIKKQAIVGKIIHKI
jgi:signal peptidase I